MSAREMVNELQSKIKEQICNLLVIRYKELHDGQLPNWGDDEDIVLTHKEIGKFFVISVDTYNTYDDFKEIELITINRYIVTLDYNLYFEDENKNEVEWTDVDIYDLADLLDGLNKLIIEK